jgi:hypothetical protein
MRKDQSNLPEKPIDRKQPPLPNYVAGSIKDNEKKEPVNQLSGTLNERLDQFQTLVDKVQDQLDEVIKVTGWTPEMLKNYLSNPSNFDDASWEMIQKERESLNKLIDQNHLKDPSSPAGPIVEKKAISKGRKTKSIGGRKNWISL